MSVDNNQSLFSLGEQVLRGLKILQNAFNQADVKAIAALDIIEITETKDRFVLWASNIGLFNPAHTSLDYRLRDNELIREFTRNLLQSLREKTSELKEIASGERTPFESLEIEDEKEIQDPDDDEATAYDERDSGSIESDVQIVIGGTSKADGQTEAALLFQQLRANVDQIFDLATQIRGPATRRVPVAKKVDLFKHISPEFKNEFIRLYEARELQGLIQVFEQCRKEVQGKGQDDMEDHQSEQNRLEEHVSLTEEDQVLLQRLLKANHIRRCYFQHWKRYKSKSMRFTSRVTGQNPLLNPAPSSSHIPSFYGGDKTSNSILSHQPSSRLTSEMPLAPEFALKGAGSSKSSRVRTVTVKGADGLAVNWPLPPPQIQKRITEFECPYCFFICPGRTVREDAWRDHLRRDLQPYVCTYLECDDPEELYYDYDAWNMHEQRTHRRIWVCKIDKESFTEQISYEQHVRSLHPESARKLLTQELISSRESTPKQCDRECPVCLRGFVHTHEMQSHIARHLEAIALLALPSGDDLESTSQHGSLAQSDVAEKHNRLLALSTAEDFPDAEGLPPLFAENWNSFEDVKSLGQGLPLTPNRLAELQKHIESSLEPLDSLVMGWRSSIVWDRLHSTKSSLPFRSSLPADGPQTTESHGTKRVKIEEPTNILPPPRRNAIVGEMFTEEEKSNFDKLSGSPYGNTEA